MIEMLIFLSVLMISYLGVERFRRWSLQKRIVDVPNERSSHAAPTPRGGGLIFVVVCLVFYAANGLAGDQHFRWSYFFGAVLVASVSWLDDLYSVKTLLRFIVHGLAASMVIYEFGFWQQIELPYFGAVGLGAAGAVLTVCWIVGLTNAYNFMDGIDGIAATQAVTAGIGWLIAGTLLGSSETALYAGVVAFACMGFLIHNRKPARIFMGDVGSAFLGFTFAVLPILAKTENAANADKDGIFPLIGVLLVWFFVFDAAYTFAARLLRKEKVWEAHRRHLYQKMIINGYTHQAVTNLYGLFSLILLTFGALAATAGRKYLVLAVPAALVMSSALIFLSRTKKNVDH